jgi:ankyrin repeat protein
MVTKEKRFSFSFLILISLSLFLLSCGEKKEINPEIARKELAKMNISCSKSSFIDRVKEGDATAVKLFLNAGMDPSSLDAGGGTALVWAIVKGHTQTAKLLLEKGANPTFPATVSQASILIISLKGIPYAVIHRDQIRDVINRGLSPLTCAMIVKPNGLDGLIRLMLEKGADPNAGKNGWVPLMFANQSNIETANILLSKGANPNI